VVGLTLRAGRHVDGMVGLMVDVAASLKDGHSLLLLGRPGVGKTSLLRDTTRFLANTLRKRVILVDTSNEIAGDGPAPHSCIGRARRMQPSDRQKQHSTLIEAVQNHNPQVIVVDELGTADEVHAARNIAQRGVCMVSKYFLLSALTSVRSSWQQHMVQRYIPY